MHSFPNSDLVSTMVDVVVTKCWSGRDIKVTFGESEHCYSMSSSTVTDMNIHSDYHMIVMRHLVQDLKRLHDLELCHGNICPDSLGVTWHSSGELINFRHAQLKTDELAQKDVRDLLRCIYLGICQQHYVDKLSLRDDSLTLLYDGKEVLRPRIRSWDTNFRLDQLEKLFKEGPTLRGLHHVVFAKEPNQYKPVNCCDDLDELCRPFAGRVSWADFEKRVLPMIRRFDPKADPSFCD